jgi:hypothetical protein
MGGRRGETKIKMEIEERVTGNWTGQESQFGDIESMCKKR